MLEEYLIGTLLLMLIALAGWIWHDGHRHLQILRKHALRKKRISLRNVQIMIANVSSGEKRPISSFFGYHRESRRIGRLKKFSRKSVEKQA